MIRHWLPAAAGVIALASGCTSGYPNGGLDSPDPADRLEAIRRTGVQYAHPKSAPARVLEQLVEQLGNGDPAVRMMAIVALEKITCDRRAYDPYAAPAERQRAIDAWIVALEAEEPGRCGDTTGREAVKTRDRSDGSG